VSVPPHVHASTHSHRDTFSQRPAHRGAAANPPAEFHKVSPRRRRRVSLSGCVVLPSSLASRGLLDLEPGGRPERAHSFRSVLRSALAEQRKPPGSSAKPVLAGRCHPHPVPLVVSRLGGFRWCGRFTRTTRSSRFQAGNASCASTISLVAVLLGGGPVSLISRCWRVAGRRRSSPTSAESDAVRGIPKSRNGKRSAVA